MIHEFRCKNVLSFRDEIELSFEATADKTYRDYYCVDVKPTLSLLKVAIIYGQNASGKSNIIRALHYLRNLITSSKEDKTDLINFKPFLLDDTSKDGFSSYHLSFFIDGQRFIYDIEHNAEYIRKEKLVYYPTSQPAIVFERAYNNDKNLSAIKFGATLDLTQKESIILEGNTIRNTSVIGIYSKSNVKIDVLDKVKDYFDNTFMDPILPSTELTVWTSSRIEKEDDKRNFVVDQLRKADFNINSIKFTEEERDLDETLAEIIKNSEIPSDEKAKVLKRKKLKMTDIKFSHDTSDGIYDLSFGYQSDGTKRYYGLSGALEEIIRNNHFLAIDEIQSSLHPHLVSHFFKTFLVNSKNSQLIFSTHDLLLMANDFMRRDVIWFIEKGGNGSSDLYSASDFKLHKNKSVFREYQLGKLGAIPDTGNIFSLISE